MIVTHGRRRIGVPITYLHEDGSVVTGTPQHDGSVIVSVTVRVGDTALRCVGTRLDSPARWARRVTALEDAGFQRTHPVPPSVYALIAILALAALIGLILHNGSAG